MFLKRFQVNQVKEQGRYNRCEAWPYFNFKCFSYLHKMEFCIIKQACDFGSNLSFQQQKNQIIFWTKNKRDRRSMNAQISTHLSQGVHCPGRLSHNSSETSGLWRSLVQLSWYHSSSAKLVCGASGSHHRFPHNILVWPHQRCWTTTARCWLNSQYTPTFWVRFFVDGWTVRMLCWIWNWQFFWLTDTYINREPKKSNELWSCCTWIHLMNCVLSYDLFT